MKYDACTINAFLFASVNLYGRFRTLLKITSVFNIIQTSVYLILEVVVFAIPKCRDTFRERRGCVVEILVHIGQYLYPNLDDSEFFLGLRGMLTIGWRFASALGIELMIKWNKIEGISSLGSTGQLVPLVISITGVVVVIYETYFSKKEGFGGPEGEHSELATKDPAVVDSEKQDMVVDVERRIIR
jgi:hypothetical protein